MPSLNLGNIYMNMMTGGPARYKYTCSNIAGRGCVHKIKRKPVQLHIPVDLLHDLDKAARALGMPRTRLILRALRRDLAAMMVHEVKKAEEQREEFRKAFGDWK